MVSVYLKKKVTLIYLLFFLVIICFVKWKYYLKKNKIPYKYFYPTTIMSIIYITILQMEILFEGRIYILFFGGMTVIFYAAGLILCFKRGCYFLEKMDKYYPHVMYKFNMSTSLNKFKFFEKELNDILESDPIAIVKEAILLRNLIKPTMLLHIEIIIIMIISDIKFFY